MAEYFDGIMAVFLLLCLACTVFQVIGRHSVYKVLRKIIAVYSIAALCCYFAWGLYR